MGSGVLISQGAEGSEVLNLAAECSSVRLSFSRDG